MGEDKKENVELRVDSTRQPISSDSPGLEEVRKRIKRNIGYALLAFGVGGVWAFISPCLPYWWSVLISLAIMGVGSLFGNKARMEIIEIRFR